MAVILNNIEMPECCFLCLFGCWSNLHQTEACYLMGDMQMFNDYSTEYRARRSASCPMEEHKPRLGRWEDRCHEKWDGSLYWCRACSACDFERDDCNSEKDTPYCPSCGAKMKIEEEKEDG